MDDGAERPGATTADWGRRAGTMIASRGGLPPEHLIDATWVSFGSISGCAASDDFRANQLLAGQDPVALDAWVAKNILYPIDRNPRHHPDFPGVDLARGRPTNHQ